MIQPRASVQGCELVFFIKEDEKWVVEEAETMKYPLWNDLLWNYENLWRQAVKLTTTS